jgi:hypothetical protein
LDAALEIAPAHPVVMQIETVMVRKTGFIYPVIVLYWSDAFAVLMAVEHYAERCFPDFWNARMNPWFTSRCCMILFAGIAFASRPLME